MWFDAHAAPRPHLMSLGSDSADGHVDIAWRVAGHDIAEETGSRHREVQCGVIAWFVGPAVGESLDGLAIRATHRS